MGIMDAVEVFEAEKKKEAVIRNLDAILEKYKDSSLDFTEVGRILLEIRIEHKLKLAYKELLDRHEHEIKQGDYSRLIKDYVSEASKKHIEVGDWVIVKELAPGKENYDQGGTDRIKAGESYRIIKCGGSTVEMEDTPYGTWWMRRDEVEYDTSKVRKDLEEKLGNGCKMKEGLDDIIRISVCWMRDVEFNDDEIRQYFLNKFQNPYVNDLLEKETYADCLEEEVAY
ncbi:MAG: hypothetical protein ABIB71_06240 [Candidatus Woesearchaeota archaeon]